MTTLITAAEETKKVVAVNRLVQHHSELLLFFLVYRYRVSIQPSTVLLIAVPDEAIDRLKDHLSHLNKWSLAGQCHVISLNFFTFQRFELSV